MSLTRDGAAELFRQPPSQWIEAGSAQIAHRQVGSGPDVLFVHGWPVSGATFRNLLPHLQDHATCHVIDLPGTGHTRWTNSTPMTIDNHVRTVRQVVDALGFDDVAVVGHDSGGLIARHALAGDGRVRAWGLVDTEQPHGPSMRFRMFLAGRRLPGYGSALAWIAGRKRLRRSSFVLGGAFVDRSLLDGEFDEFFLAPLRASDEHRQAATALLRSFSGHYFDELAALHRRIDVPVGLVWGVEDPFFPVAWAREMVATFADARLDEIAHAALFAHEERAADVAAALLRTIVPAAR